VTTRATIPEQITMLRQLYAEASAEERADVAETLVDTINLLRWIDANASTIKAVHKAMNDPAYKALKAEFPDVEIKGVRT